jgi:protein-serine/threonine kinase
MTQLFNSNSNSALSEKRTFSGLALSSNRQVNGSNSQVSQRIKNFFRINSHGSSDSKDRKHSDDGPSTPKVETKSTFRSSKFLPHISRNRSQTVASEGNPLEDSMSPTAHANPYFIHQGPPALRHHNEGSVPPSPPDTPPIPTTKIEAVSGANDQATTAGKEELARKLRRVASAPNAQGLFSSGKSSDRPQTAELGKQPLIQHANSSTLSMVETATPDPGHLIPVGPAANGTIPTPGQIRNAAAFRRTYSSNSIKVRNVEVGPGSFDKIKLIGKGDVGKVYLVREKKSSRLYAMKGRLLIDAWVKCILITSSLEQKGDDQAQQDQTSSR